MLCRSSAHAARAASAQMLSLAVGYGCFLAAAAVTLAIVPSDLRPRHGWTLAYEWISFLMLGLLALWLTVRPPRLPKPRTLNPQRRPPTASTCLCCSV